jgi:hypothetical protein
MGMTKLFSQLIAFKPSLNKHFRPHTMPNKSCQQNENIAYFLFIGIILFLGGVPAGSSTSTNHFVCVVLPKLPATLQTTTKARLAPDVNVQVYRHKATVHH